MKYLLNDFILEEHVKSALAEDIGYGDITTDFVVDENKVIEIDLKTREEGIFCGEAVFRKVFEILDKTCEIEFFIHDGEKIQKGDKIATIKGSARAILTGERVALNYTQKMSGIASYTNKFVEKIKNYKARIVDTRKNTPNFRMFEKYAIKTGGASLHRFNLSDCTMLKDNHIASVGSITGAVNKLRENLSHAHKIEVECDTLEQVREAVSLNVDIIMLDNMTLDEMKTAIETINGRAIVEASGGVTIDSIEEIAKVGVDIISSGALCNKAQTLDLGFDYHKC